jgi:hypothetical protein
MERHSQEDAPDGLHIARPHPFFSVHSNSEDLNLSPRLHDGNCVDQA